MTFPNKTFLRNCGFRTLAIHYVLGRYFCPLNLVVLVVVVLVVAIYSLDIIAVISRHLDNESHYQPFSVTSYFASVSY